MSDYASTVIYARGVRRDRDGSVLEDEQLLERPDRARLLHELLCVDGWAGEDLDGRPRPCPVCRPHLERGRGRLRRALYGRHAA